MFPGVNPAQARQMMKKMGIRQTDYDAAQVIIKLPDKDLVFDNPSVSMVSMQGQDTFQINGEYTEVLPQATITDEDVSTVMEQTQCDEAEAKEALQNHNGDIAAAILSLSEQ
jgi:nascent polypeptide-associated complex subunit alpha